MEGITPGIYDLRGVLLNPNVKIERQLTGLTGTLWVVFFQDVHQVTHPVRGDDEPKILY